MKKEEIMARVIELAKMDEISRDEAIRELAREAGLSIGAIREAVRAKVRELRAEEKRARREEEARAREEAKLRIAEARARAEATAAETTRVAWKRLREEEPRLPAEAPPGMYLALDGTMMGWAEGSDGPVLVHIGPPAVAIQEVPGAVIFLARDPWRRWIHITVPTSELATGRFATRFADHGVVPCFPSLWITTIREIWMASREQILTHDPEPQVDIAVEAARVLWGYFTIHRYHFHGYPNPTNEPKQEPEIHGTIVSWDKKVIVIGFRPEVFAKILREAGLDAREVKHALWARKWIGRDRAGNFSLNLPISRGGIRNTRFVVVNLTEVANEPIDDEVLRDIQNQEKEKEGKEDLKRAS